MRLDSDSLFARVLRCIAQAVCRNPAWFIYPQIALAVVCGVYTAFRLKLDMNRGHLIGPHLEAHRVYLQFVREFPDQDQLVVVVESANPQQDRQFVERLAAKVKPQTNLFADVFYKADPTTLGPKALLLASTNDLRDMKATLAEYLPSIREFAQATNLDSLFEMVNRQFRTAAPEQNQQTAALLHSLPMLQKIVSEATKSMVRLGRPPPPGLDTLLSGGTEAQSQIYITLDHGRLYLLNVRPRSEAVTPKAIVALRQAIAQTRLEVPGVDAGLTGGPVLDYDEMKQAVLGLMGTAGIPFNPANVMILPLVVGIGVTNGIQVMNRFAEEQNARILAKSTGKAVLVSGLTATTGFATLMLAQHQGIKSLGEVMSVGILACMVAGLTFLPAVLALLGRKGWTVPMRVGRRQATA